MTLASRAEQFRSLHREGCFVLPNAWDAGSARLLASLGFPAIATTSAGLAFMLGCRDGAAAISRTEALANAGDIAGAADLPVSADLEDGYGPTPEDCATTVRLAAAVGLCGCTIEDTTANPASPIHAFDAAVARVRAAAWAAWAAPIPFVLTARAENYLHGRPDLDDTVRRLVASRRRVRTASTRRRLTDMACIRTVVAAVAPRPVNVLIGPRDGLLSAESLAEAGVRRISVRGALARAAYGEMLRVAGLLRGGNLPAAMSGIVAHDTIQILMRPQA